MTNFFAKPVKGAAESQSRMPRSLKGLLRDFADDESGVLVAFSIWFMLMILFVGALGVDVMRYETQRSKLQHTLDQAVLAAADLDQKGQPYNVVEDYFAKSGVDADLTAVDVDQGLNYRDVQARAEQIVPTQLIHMLGIDEWTAPAASRAEERVDSVEISMVLDVSGSMNGNRINRLRPAARDFVDTVLDLSDADDISISIVPYATQVSIPQALEAEFRTHDDQPYSRCFNFEASDFDSTGMQPLAGGSRSYERTQHFDPWYWVEDSQGLSYLSRNRTGRTALPVCSDRPASEILPLSNDVSALHGAINGLEAGGNTSIDIGVKWGAALLDPSLQPVVSNLASAGEIDSVFDGRPLSFEDNDVIKVLVVMTDGQNTSQYMLREQFRSGDSDVYYDAGSDRYAIYYNNRYYYQRYSGNYRIEWGDWTWSLDSDWNRLSYPELFARASTYWIDWTLYGNFGSYNWRYSPRTYVGGSSKDNRLQTICDAAKDQNTVIYTIGFEAPWHGANELQDCASSPSHFFDVEGLEIEEAFSAIAQSISQLKLTQ